MTLAAAVKLFVALGCYQAQELVEPGALPAPISFSNAIYKCSEADNYCGTVHTRKELLEHELKMENIRLESEKKENERVGKCKEAFERMEKEK